MRTPANALLLASALPALAQTPPIQPGLWQLAKFEASRDGARRPRRRAPAWPTG